MANISIVLATYKNSSYEFARIWIWSQRKEKKLEEGNVRGNVMRWRALNRGKCDYLTGEKDIAELGMLRRLLLSYKVSCSSEESKKESRLQVSQQRVASETAKEKEVYLQ